MATVPYIAGVKSSLAVNKFRPFPTDFIILSAFHLPSQNKKLLSFWSMLRLVFHFLLRINVQSNKSVMSCYYEWCSRGRVAKESQIVLGLLPVWFWDSIRQVRDRSAIELVPNP